MTPAEPEAGQTWQLRSNGQLISVTRVTRGMVFTNQGRVLRKTWNARFRPTVEAQRLREDSMGVT